MSNSSPHDREDDPLVLPAALQHREAYTPWWSGLLGPIQAIVGLMPAHKNTRSGRQSGRRIKFVLGGVGSVMIIFGQDPVLMAAGFLILGGAPWLPLPQVKKRALQNRLQSLRAPRSRPATEPAELRWEGRRLVLARDGETMRRVLTGRGEHIVRAGDLDGTRYLMVAPPSEKKSETIWVATDPSADLPEGLALEELDPERVDQPCRVEPEAWTQLAGELMGV